MSTERSSTAQNSLEFLYRTAATRGPGKRPLRIVKADQFDADAFDISDEDDEDYRLSEDEQNKPSSSLSSSESGEENDAGEEGSNQGANGVHSPTQKRRRSDAQGSPTKRAGSSLATVMGLGKSVDSAASKLTDSTGDTALICCVCLNMRSASEDVIQCDSCGLTVHEGCYGITDADSELSDSSVESTEPWFCEPCLAGFQPEDVFCELCPNRHGAFKRTSTGSWVHLICALYNPHVMFLETDDFGVPTLSDADYSMFGSRACALCVNKAMARTGMVINCDAGLCRTFFHVTCSQRRGLLVDSSVTSVTTTPESVADPFYACCSFHSDPEVVATKRRRYDAMQRQLVRRISHKVLTKRESNCLQRKRKKFLARFKSYFYRCSFETGKRQRLLTTSAEALTMLLLKSQFFDVASDDEDWNDEFHMEFAPNIVGKFFMPISFTADFITYYSKREKFVLTLSSTSQVLTEENAVLRQAQDDFKDKIQTLQATSKDLETVAMEDYKKLLTFTTLCLEMSAKNTASWGKLFPDLERRRHKEHTPGSVNNQAAQPRTSVSSADTTSSPIYTCETCSQSHDQHLLVFCDTCRHYYHLGCLDPPLKRMPKKTSVYGWECSTCAQRGSESSDDDTVAVDVDTPRQLRTSYKPVQRFITEIARDEHEPATSKDVASVEARQKPPRKKPGPKPRKHLAVVTNNETISPKLSPRLRRPRMRRRRHRIGPLPRRRRPSAGVRATIAVKPASPAAFVKSLSARRSSGDSAVTSSAKNALSPGSSVDKIKTTPTKSRDAAEPCEGVADISPSEEVKPTLEADHLSPTALVAPLAALKPIVSDSKPAKTLAKALSVLVAAGNQHVVPVATVRAEAIAVAAPAPPVLVGPSVLSTNNFIVDSYDRSDVGMEVEVRNSAPPKPVTPEPAVCDNSRRRLSYSCEAMTKAVEAVLNGKMGARRASLLYGVPRSTIGRHVRNVRGYFATSKNENVEIIRVEDLD